MPIEEIEVPALSARQFEILIKRWDMTQNGMARWLGADERTVRRWIADDRIPSAVARLLRLMVALGLTPDKVDAKLEGVTI